MAFLALGALLHQDKIQSTVSVETKYSVKVLMPNLRRLYISLQ